ncbi:MAG: YdcF family protein [Gloeocapsa sp. UFS-A4-WI-NPMV-4B04]|jgi:uncharacterized SAM-binding protein YcdF (DUF218 family)|nr:YdcF family protein [Gloeocapsa sp. UFS-A4-WI-NPMV-4B04]
MFLYLSKLLPLFFYPLGLACVLMVAALLTLKKRPRWAAGAITLALIVLVGASNGWVSSWLVRSLEAQIPPAVVPTAQAIVVLGGATKPALPPRPGVDLSEQGDRIFYAAQLYKQQKAPLIIVSGGRIDWTRRGTPESADMANILSQIGVPASAIIQDPDSLNTYENAVNVRKILNERDIRQILLVTSAMHMPRSLLIFKHQGIAVIPAPTDFLVSNNQLQSLSSSPQATLLNLLPDSDRLEHFTRALKEYVGLVVYRLRGWL